MRRRDFIKVIGGAAATWPVAVRSQQGERMRRIGVLMFSAKEDPQSMLKLGAFVEELQRLNWTKDNNAQIDIRWDAADTARSRSYVAELLALAPDIIVSHGSPATAALQEATRTLPIVFVNVTDPVGAGYVASLARPGGNATGFSYVEYGMSGKWLELLK
ncbi:MAG: ABC transporter substrate binding protein, partial [Pseudolabrys sp.]